jgi:arylformamidase
VGGSGVLRDISVAVGPGTPEWPGDTPYACGWPWRIASGASVNVSSITMSPHVGTHADAPLHVHDGWPGADALPLDAFVGRARLVDVSDVAGPIDLPTLGRRVELAGVARLLLRTGRTIADRAFPAEWPVLSEECAHALAAGGLRLVGVDCPSVDERESKSLAVHRALFAGGASILENLDLRHVHPGEYELLAPPLSLTGLDAAPVRALLRALSLERSSTTPPDGRTPLAR